MGLTAEQEALLINLLQAELDYQESLKELRKVANKPYHPLFETTSRYLVLKGGGGSGKSIFAGQKLLWRLTHEKGHRFLVARKVAKTLRESCWQQLRQQIAEYYDPLDFVVNKSDMTITHRPSGNQILFSGLDDVEKLKSIAGITGIWIEEASELEEGDFNQLDIRLRGQTVNYKQIVLSFNPVSISHWLKTRFFDRVDEEATTSETTYKDNRFLDAPAIKVLEGFKATDPYYYAVYCLGQWGVLGKTVFDAEKLTYRQAQAKKVSQCHMVEKNGVMTTLDAPDGYWMIYKRPEPKRTYCIGADVAEGLETGDYSTVQVMDVVTLEQVAVLQAHIDPDLLSEELNRAGWYYNKALISVEVNMEGGVIRNLERLRYPNLYMREHLDEITHKIVKKFGWRTTETSRRLIIANLIEYVRDHSNLLNCPVTIDEMLTFIRNKNGRPEAQEGKHDDLVMALAICLEACLSGQQSRGSFEKTIDYDKVEKLDKDFQDDFYRADIPLKEVMADRLDLWKT